MTAIQRVRIAATAASAGLLSAALALFFTTQTAQPVVAAGFILDTAFGPGVTNANANFVGRELAAGGNKVLIGDAVPDPSTIKTVTWNLAPAGVPIGPDPPGPAGPPLSVAPPAGALAAIQAAFATIDTGGNRLIFTQDPTAASHNSQAAKGNIIDIFFKDFGGAPILGGTEVSGAVTTVGGGNLVVEKVDIVLGSTLKVFDPTKVPAGYKPVLNPLVNPYAIFTGDTQGNSPGDIESTFLHEAMHALGLQHPDRTVQNFNTNARFTRNYATSLTGTTVNAALSFQINEDQFFNTGLIRTVEGPDDVLVTPLGLAKNVNPSNASSAAIDSIGDLGEINRLITPDDNGGLAFVYQDFIRQGIADTLQTATAARYAGVTVESDWSRIAGDANNNNWNDDPAQATRNDLAANAQAVGAVTGHSLVQILGSIAGRTDGAESGKEVKPGRFSGGDVDYYKFTANAGDKLLIDLDEGDLIGNPTDTAIEIFNAAGDTLFASADNDVILSYLSKDDSLSRNDPAFYFTVPGMAGIQNLLVKVSSVGPKDMGTVFFDEGDYVLRMQVIPEPATIALLCLSGVLLIGRCALNRKA